MARRVGFGLSPTLLFFAVMIITFLLMKSPGYYGTTTENFISTEGIAGIIALSAAAIFMLVWYFRNLAGGSNNSGRSASSSIQNWR
jgi:hypothetical protein